MEQNLCSYPDMAQNKKYSKLVQITPISLWFVAYKPTFTSLGGTIL